MRALTLLSVLALTACSHPAPVESAAAPVDRAMPGPLKARDFTMPTVERRTLSNGLEVVVATNDEVPLFEVRLALKVGGYLDPEGQAGLASVTFDMLNEGAGDLTAEDISRELKRLGSSVSSGAGATSASVTASGLVRNLEPTLDLWAKVVTEPTFPAKDWEVLQSRRIADVVAERESPTSVARNVSYKLLYNGTYTGRVPVEADYEAMTPDLMRSFFGQWVGPANAVLFVGGALTADQVVPLLEERLGTWAPEGVTEAAPEAAPVAPEASTLYFVDKPGAAQSVLRLATPIGTRASEDYFDLFMANEVLGGQFTSRVNMLLREEKGYTYGARCFTAFQDGPGLWGCQTSVQTEVTGPALADLRDLILGLRGDQPVTEDELAYFQSNTVHGFPGQYETFSAVLGEQFDIWRYSLPADWLERQIPGVKAVTVEGANAAFAAHVDPERLSWVVVGDREAIYEDLVALGLPLVELDRDGNPLATE